MKIYCIIFVFIFCIITNSIGALSEDDIINHAKTLAVNSLEPGLPNQPLDTWMKTILGPNWHIRWALDQCGLAGIPLDAGTEDHICVTIVGLENVTDGLGINEPEIHKLEIKLSIADKHLGYLAQPHLYYVSFFRFGVNYRYNNKYLGQDTEALSNISLILPTLKAHQEEDVIRISNTRQAHRDTNRREFLAWIPLIGGIVVLIIFSINSYSSLSYKIEQSQINLVDAKFAFLASTAQAYGISGILLLCVNLAERIIGGTWLFAGEAGLGIFIVLFINLAAWIFLILVGILLLSIDNKKQSQQ